MLKFKDIVSIKETECSKYFLLEYSLPCQLNKDIVQHLSAFGKPIYSLKTIRLLKIESKDGFKIDGNVGKKIINFSMPISFKNKQENDIWRKKEFDTCLALWLSRALDMPIMTSEQIGEDNNEG